MGTSTANRGGASHRRRATTFLAAFAVTVVLALCLSGGASADTAFGGDPAQAVTPELSCAFGAPPYFAGGSSCTWTWSNLGIGSDIVPFPPSGGSGTITSVTLPAMPNPGPMQVVVLTAGLAAGTSPSQPDYVCCQVKEIGPTFTIPANQVTTVPQSLAVSATEEADLSVPGDTSFGDEMAISVLSPSASLPVRYTGAASIGGPGGFDGALAHFPALTQASGEFLQMVDPVGYQLLARFTLGSGPGQGGGEAAANEGAAGGLDLRKGALRTAPNGRTVALGKATNPPTARTTQTLTAPAARPAARSSRKGGKKPTVLGHGSTKVPIGKTVGLKLRLNGKGRAVLRRKHKLKATLTIIATNVQGQKQTVTERVTIKPAKRKKR